MRAKIKENSKNIAGIIFLLLSIAAFKSILKFTTGFDVWYDEVFSLSFVKYNFQEIVRLTAKDVHPPLYYFYLKVIIDAITGIAGQDSFFFAAKIASTLPWIVLLVIALFYIRKRFSFFCAGLFMFFITVMPQIPVYYLEIRMYSLALLLITSHILIAERIISYEKTNNYLWIIFFLLGILTAYTQYYACIATIGIYIGTGIALLIQKEKPDRRKNIVRLFISAALSAVFYAPWLTVLKNQMNGISGKYWIQPLTVRSIFGCIKFITLPDVYAGNAPMIAAILMIVSIAVIMIAPFFADAKKKTDRTNHLVLALIMVIPLISVIISGFILSACGTPIFIYRYMIPALGGMWLFVAISLDRLIKQRFRYRILMWILIIPFVFAGALTYKGFCDEEGKKLYEEVNARQAVEQLQSGSVIITNFDHVTSVMGLYRPDCEICLYEAEIDNLLPAMHENISDNIHDEDILNVLKSGKKVYFLGSFNAREDIVKAWEEKNIKVTMTNSMLVERYWINIYELEEYGS